MRLVSIFRRRSSLAQPVMTFIRSATETGLDVAVSVISPIRSDLPDAGPRESGQDLQLLDRDSRVGCVSDQLVTLPHERPLTFPELCVEIRDVVDHFLEPHQCDRDPKRGPAVTVRAYPPGRHFDHRAFLGCVVVPTPNYRICTEALIRSPSLDTNRPAHSSRQIELGSVVAASCGRDRSRLALACASCSP